MIYSHKVFEEMCPAITKEKVLELFLEVDRDKVQRVSASQNINPSFISEDSSILDSF